VPNEAAPRKRAPLALPAGTRRGTKHLDLAVNERLQPKE